MKSSSIKMVMEHGIKEPRVYRDQLIHDFFIPKEIAERLSKFYLSREAFDSVYDDIHDGELEEQGKIYHVVWIHHPESCRKHGKVEISFRYCQLLDCGYALIRKDEGQTKAKDRK